MLIPISSIIWPGFFLIDWNPISKGSRFRLIILLLLLILCSKPKLYIPGTLNIDLILCHTQWIVYAVKSWAKSWVISFTFQAYTLPNTLNCKCVSLSKFHIWILWFYDIHINQRVIWNVIAIYWTLSYVLKTLVWNRRQLSTAFLWWRIFVHQNLPFFSTSKSTIKFEVFHLTSEVAEVRGGHEKKKCPNFKSDTTFINK